MTKGSWSVATAFVDEEGKWVHAETELFPGIKHRVGRFTLAELVDQASRDQRVLRGQYEGRGLMPWLNRSSHQTSSKHLLLAVLVYLHRIYGVLKSIADRDEPRCDVV